MLAGKGVKGWLRVPVLIAPHISTCPSIGAGSIAATSVASAGESCCICNRP